MTEEHLRGDGAEADAGSQHGPPPDAGGKFKRDARLQDLEHEPVCPFRQVAGRDKGMRERRNYSARTCPAVGPETGGDIAGDIRRCPRDGKRLLANRETG